MPGMTKQEMQDRERMIFLQKLYEVSAKNNEALTQDEQLEFIKLWTTYEPGKNTSLANSGLMQQQYDQKLGIPQPKPDAPDTDAQLKKDYQELIFLLTLKERAGKGINTPLVDQWQASALVKLQELQRKYPEMATKSAAEMQAEYVAQFAPPTQVVVQSSKDTDDLIDAYMVYMQGKNKAKKDYTQEEWFKQAYPEGSPKPDAKNQTVLQFPSPEDAQTFFKEQAAAGKKFVVVDYATGKVIAYSNGGSDTKLYKVSGANRSEDKEFTNPSDFAPSEMSLADFMKSRLQEQRPVAPQDMGDENEHGHGSGMANRK